MVTDRGMEADYKKIYQQILSLEWFDSTINHELNCKLLLVYKLKLRKHEQQKSQSSDCDAV
jgi:hypothetical protein